MLSRHIVLLSLALCLMVTGELHAQFTTVTLSFEPPLSVNDCLRLIRKMSSVLPREPGEPVSAPPSLPLAVASVINYVKFIDETHSNLSYYRWYYLGRKRIDEETLSWVAIDLKPILRRVSAISLRVEDARLFCQNLEVSAAEGEKVSFQVERWLEPDLPQREVFFLYFPVDVRQVRMSGQVKEDERARVWVYGGVSPLPEYGKACLYYLRGSQEYLKQGQLAEARRELESAWDALWKFKQSRQL